MLHIILTILKIIGILLLVLLGIVLFVILSGLFVPLRYTAAGEKFGENTKVRIKLTWFLRIFRVEFNYPEPGSFTLKVLFFTVFDSKAEPRKAKVKKRKRLPEHAEEAPAAEDNKKEEEAPGGEDGAAEAPDQHENGRDMQEERAEAIPEKIPFFIKLRQIPEKIIGFLKKIHKFFRNIKYTISALCDRIKKIFRNLQYYKELWQGEQAKAVMRKCGLHAGKIFRSFMPRKCRISVRLGTGQPDLTGYILAVNGMLYPWIGDTVVIEPDFEKVILEGSFYLQGRITFFILLKAALSIYFDKNTRYVIKKLKANREESEYGRE